jgi:hypothetical protein
MAVVVVVTLVGLNIKHQELATEGSDDAEPVIVGA